MTKPPVALVPAPSDLAKLTDSQTSDLVNLIARVNTLGQRYPILGMICGTLSFISCLAAFVYLVIAGHPKSALVVLGTAVLAIIRQMTTGR